MTTTKIRPNVISLLLNQGKPFRDFRVKTIGYDSVVRVFSLSQDSERGEVLLLNRGYETERRSPHVFLVTGRAV